MLSLKIRLSGMMSKWRSIINVEGTKQLLLHSFLTGQAELLMDALIRSSGVPWEFFRDRQGVKGHVRINGRQGERRAVASSAFIN